MMITKKQGAERVIDYFITQDKPWGRIANQSYCVYTGFDEEKGEVHCAIGCQPYTISPTGNLTFELQPAEFRQQFEDGDIRIGRENFWVELQKIHDNAALSGSAKAVFEYEVRDLLAKHEREAS